MKFVTIENWHAEPLIDYRPELETGNVLFFPVTPFVLPADAQDFLRGLNFSGGAVHKNIAYRPASDRVTGVGGDPATAERLRGIMGDYSRAVIDFAGRLLPEYARAWKVDYASFRPLEEQGRGLPLNKRNDLLHTDAFPSRPTNGDLILRVFTNIHPSKTRNWMVTDPFPVVAAKYAKSAGLQGVAEASGFAYQSARFFGSLGLPVVARSPYDRFMLHFHEYLKRNSDFQATTPKYRFDFPPGSTWLTFTDLVPHAVYSGQHALEQTLIVSRGSMADPGRAPVAVLEQLCGRKLVRESGFSRAASN
ncbi:MAG: Kdo hydroxylase family protein [Acidobacteriaceae bacterium]|nr:Kdo hydroxylase family protein [Acidobacteriaceae bacterium]